MKKKKPEYTTMGYLPRISAAAIRVMVLDDPESRIDSCPDWVRLRIEDAEKTLRECADRMDSLERYVSLVIAAEKKAFRRLCKETQE